MPGNELKLQMDLPPGRAVRRSLLGWMELPVEWADAKSGDVPLPDLADGRQGTIDEALADREMSQRVDDIIRERFDNLQDPGDPCSECGWKGGFDQEGFCPRCGTSPAKDNRVLPDDAEATSEPEPEPETEQEEAPEGPQTSRKARQAAGVA